MEKWLILRLEQEIRKINLERLAISESKQVLKTKEKGWGHIIKDTGTAPKLEKFHQQNGDSNGL